MRKSTLGSSGSNSRDNGEVRYSVGHYAAIQQIGNSKYGVFENMITTLVREMVDKE